jgi:hypothetical protein
MALFSAFDEKNKFGLTVRRNFKQLVIEFLATANLKAVTACQAS